VQDIGSVEIQHHRDDMWVVALAGEHDVSNAGSLEQGLREAHSHRGRVALDLTETTFMDSTVIRMIVSERDRAAAVPDDSFRVVAPTGSLARRALELVALGDLLAESREDAFAGSPG
jgi:anti-anti-sigma factor